MLAVRDCIALSSLGKWDLEPATWKTPLNADIKQPQTKKKKTRRSTLAAPRGERSNEHFPVPGGSPLPPFRAALA